MKVCIFDIKRFAIHDGPGIRTTVFFKGCPLDCWWCHNPEGIVAGTQSFTEKIVFDGVRMEKKVEAGRWLSVEELMNELERDRIFMDESSGGITISGGEPLQQADALFRLLELSRERDIHCTVDTSGYASEEKIRKLSGLADLILFDLKSMDEEKHLKYTGVSNILILQNLEKLLVSGTDLIVRIPLITGFNDSDVEITAILKFLRSFDSIRGIDLLPYHRLGDHKYKRFNRENRQNGFANPGQKRIHEIRNTITNAGYSVKIGG